MRKTINELTEREFRKVMNSDYKDTFMRYGYTITAHIDTSLELCDIYTIEGVDDLFTTEEEALNKCIELFKNEVESNPNRFKGEAWAIGHIDQDQVRQGKVAFYYEEGLHGLGQELSYHAVRDIACALWFNNLDEVCQFLKQYCYNDEAILISVSKRQVYEALTGVYLL